jgi:hypothetical protein
MVSYFQTAAAVALVLILSAAASAQTAPSATPAPVVTPVTPAPIMTPASVMTPVPAMTPAASPSASASPSALPTATPVPENALVTARVQQEFNAWLHGRIDRKTYSPSAGGTYDDAVIAVVSPDLAAIGPLQTVQYRTASLLLGDLVYRYDINGSQGAVSVLLALNQRGQTDSIVFTPIIFRTTANPQ